MVRRIVFLASIGLFGLYACKDADPHPAVEGASDGPPSGGGGAGGGGGGGGAIISDAGGLLDGGVCTDLVLAGALVDEEAVSDETPIGTGGVVADGTYDIVTAQQYVGATGLSGQNDVTYQSTIRITGGTTFERVTDQGSAANPTALVETRYEGAIAFAGVNATISLLCPSAATEQLTYTATDTSLILTNQLTRESFTYQLRP